MMFFPPLVFPPAPVDYNIPPTLYSILNAIVNFGSEEQTKIKDLASVGRSEIFDFSYPLSEKVDKEDFECMILNHFMERRIGRDTVTAFKLALNVKLNEIMPIYNKMFDMLDEWNLFNDGEIINETGSNSLNNQTSSNNISDRRYSDTPQDRLTDIQDGTYMSDYNYDHDYGTVGSETTGSDSRRIVRTPSDKIEIYKKFMENKTAIYTMIFKDLDPLFYGLV